MMPFLDRKYDGMQAKEAFEQNCMLLKLPGSTKYVNQRILKTLHKTCDSHRRYNGQVSCTNGASTSCPVRAAQTQSYPFYTEDISGVWVACAGQRVYSNIVHGFWPCMGYCRRTQWSDRPD